MHILHITSNLQCNPTINKNFFSKQTKNNINIIQKNSIKSKLKEK